MLKSVVITSRNNSNLCLPTLIFFVSEYKTCRSLGKKERVSKHKLSKGCHQGQNIIFLAVLERLEFKNFSYRPTMVADNTFQCSMAPPLWNPFCRPWFWKHAAKFTGEHPCWSEIYTSASVFSCKFAAYFQSMLLQEHLWRAASGPCYCLVSISNKLKTCVLKMNPQV